MTGLFACASRRQRTARAKKGRSRGVLIHFHSHVRLFSIKKVARAMTVTMWMLAIAHGCTDPLARGVKTKRMYIEYLEMLSRYFIG